MREFLGKVVHSILGAITGAITGIGAGFVHSYYFWSDPACWSGDGAAANLLLYPLTLPYFILMQMGMGAYEGATKGISAGLHYAKAFNTQMQVQENLRDRPEDNFHIDLLNDLIARSSHPVVLTAQETKQFLQLLDAPDTAPEKKVELMGKFIAYKNAVNQLVCPLTTLPLDKLELPLLIRADNKTVFCEARAFKALANECLQKNIPVSFSKSDNPPAREIITNKDVLLCDRRVKNIGDYLPAQIVSFVKEVRNLFTTTAMLAKTLGYDLLKVERAPVNEKYAAEPVIVNNTSPTHSFSPCGRRCP